MSATPLSFCMVTTFYPPHNFGGDGIYVQRLSHELARRGHDVTVVSAPDAYELLGGDAVAAAPEPDGLVLEPLAPRLGRVSPLITYLSGRPGLRARQLRELFAERRFDVVHFHNVSLVGGPGVLEYGEGVKLYTTHEHWLVCPMHTLWKLNREVCERPTCLRCTLSYRRPPQLWRYGSLLERRSRDVDLFLAPSRFTIEMHRRRGFTAPMRRLPPFVPLAAAATPEGGRPQGERPYFLVVGRLERLKGMQSLIDVFARYDSADLVVAGEGSEGAELRRRAANLGHVRFVGRLPFEELASLYAGATAVLAASIGYETFGMTVLEGFAQKTPAIVRALGPLPEAVEESGAGFVYRTDVELVEALETLRTDRGLRDELGGRGYAAYRERWSEEPHLRTYFGFIEELLRSGPEAARSAL